MNLVQNYRKQIYVFEGDSGIKFQSDHFRKQKLLRDLEKINFVVKTLFVVTILGKMHQFCVTFNYNKHE